MVNTIKINKWAMIVTALLYLTFWGGILCQIILGFFQVIVFLRILIKWKEVPTNQKLHLKIYGILTGLIITLTILLPHYFIGVLWIGSFGLVAYFTIILNKLKKLELWN